MDTNNRAAIIIVPRDRYSTLPRCIESVYRHTDVPFRVIVVEGNSGGKMRAYLNAKKKQYDNLDVLFHDALITSSQAYNIGLKHAHEQWVATLESDVEVYPQWLGKMIRCAQEENAAVVAPLVLEGAHRIHVAACFFDFINHNGKEYLARRLMHFHTKLNGIPQQKRQRVDYTELHGFLMNRTLLPDTWLFEETVPPDEVDLGMLLRERGLSVYFEPSAIISYFPPPPIYPMDFEQFKIRWSKEKLVQQTEYLTGRWKILFWPDGYESLRRFWRRNERRLPTFVRRFPSPVIVGWNNLYQYLKRESRMLARDVVFALKRFVRGKTQDFVR
jgi:GT2 family glycosyltransferase